MQCYFFAHLVSYNRRALHYEPGVLQRSHILERIARNGNDVRDLPATISGLTTMCPKPMLDTSG